MLDKGCFYDVNHVDLACSYLLYYCQFFLLLFFQIKPLVALRKEK